MLARWADGTKGSRSQVIDASDGGAPAALDRRLGFTGPLAVLSPGWSRR
jgi:hypothetical protein